MELVGRIRSEPQAEVLVNLLGVFPYEALWRKMAVVNPMPLVSRSWGTVGEKKKRPLSGKHREK